MGRYIATAPDRLRTRAQGNLVAAADAGNAVIDRVLGVQGSEHDRSRPGEVPRRQTGRLQKQTRWVAAASRLELTLYTTSVGAILQDGVTVADPRPYRGPVNIAPRPFREAIVEQSRGPILEALRRPGRRSVYDQ